jgi:cytochrome c biogenesis protein CcmG, thiol:disulfide interchange protein DsbE
MKMFIYSIIVTVLLFLHALGQEVPEISTQTISGENISLQQLISNGPTLVSFWALWCEPCKLELRNLQALFEKYSSQHFSILAINQDDEKSVAKVTAYIASQNYTFQIIVDPNNEIAEMFNIQNIPFSILYDRHGTVAYQAIGYKPGDEKKLEAAIENVFSKENPE